MVFKGLVISILLSVFTVASAAPPANPVRKEQSSCAQSLTLELSAKDMLVQNIISMLESDIIKELVPSTSTIAWRKTYLRNGIINHNVELFSMNLLVMLSSLTGEYGGEDVGSLSRRQVALIRAIVDFYQLLQISGDRRRTVTIEGETGSQVITASSVFVRNSILGKTEILNEMKILLKEEASEDDLIEFSLKINFALQYFNGALKAPNHDGLLNLAEAYRLGSDRARKYILGIL